MCGIEFMYRKDECKEICVMCIYEGICDKNHESRREQEIICVELC